MTVIAMSRTEIDRMSVLHDLADGRIRIAEASTLMGLGRRQVFPLTKAYGEHGPQVLVSRRRGRPSNRCYPTALRAKNWHHQAPPTSGCFQLVRYGVLEGMIHGLAVASSAVGGPGETLRDGETGLLFPPRDARALAQSILHWQLIRIFGAEWPRRSSIRPDLAMAANRREDGFCLSGSNCSAWSPRRSDFGILIAAHRAQIDVVFQTCRRSRITDSPEPPWPALVDCEWPSRPWHIQENAT